MAHYSEMDFLFTKNIGDKKEVTKILDNTNADNIANIFNSKKYVVYKEKNKYGTENIKKHYTKSLESSTQNPYTKLLNDFSDRNGSPRAGLRLRAGDFAYLRDLGVYPINRMAILRRFPEGCFVPEDLNEMKIEPISTVIGWVKPDQNFGTVGFNEKWTTTTDRFDILLTKIVKKAIGMEKSGPLVPIPDFAQGVLFEFYKQLELTQRSGVDDSVDENYESYDTRNSSSPWGLSRIPIGDPNVLQEGPFRDPEGQNIQSNFTFELETTYEQKILGEVDPGSAMLDILDNLYAMGTSNMTFYWGDSAPTIRKAMEAASGQGNNLNAWWDFTSQIMTSMWDLITDLFKNLYKKSKEIFDDSKPRTKEQNDANIQSKKDDIQSLETQKANANNNLGRRWRFQQQIIKAKEDLAKLEEDGKNLKPAKGISSTPSSSNIQTNSGNAVTNAASQAADTLSAAASMVSIDNIQKILQSILTSTIAIYRFNIRGSIELMVGGKYSSTPWYLTLGNPYTPWMSTNHMIVDSATIETSNEMGFNDQPQRLTAKFSCKFSRALGKQELMRMFNNTYRRTYSDKFIKFGDQTSNLIGDVVAAGDKSKIKNKSYNHIETIKSTSISNNLSDQGLMGL